MRKFIYEYTKKMDFQYSLMEIDAKSIEAKSCINSIAFEKEDSEFAPEPSVACGLRADNGLEFGLIYLQASEHLLVFGEKAVERKIAVDTFLSIFPELTPFVTDTYGFRYS